MSDPFERPPYLARIDFIYAILAMDEGAGEGVVTFLNKDTWVPMIAADERRLEELMPHAEAFVRERGVSARLVRFSMREVIKDIEP